MILAVSGLFHVFCSGMYLKTHVLKGRSRKQNTTSTPFSHCIKESTTRFLLVFSIYYCSRQPLWKCNTKSLLSQPLLLHWQRLGNSFLEHRGPQASLWVENCHCQCHRAHTHTHEQEGKRKRALARRGASFWGSCEQPTWAHWTPHLQQPPNTSARLADAWCTFSPFSLEMVIP